MKLSKKTLLISLIILAIVLIAVAFTVYYFFFMNNSDYISLSRRNKSIITEMTDGDISKYLGQKNLLVVWASWCPHCIEELPNILEVEKEYKNINFIYVSHDETKEELEDFITLNKYNMFILHDKEKLIRAKLDPGASGIPSFYLLDKDGKILGGNKGGLTKDEVKSFIDSNGETGNGKLVPAK